MKRAGEVGGGTGAADGVGCRVSSARLGWLVLLVIAMALIGGLAAATLVDASLLITVSCPWSSAPSAW